MKTKEDWQIPDENKKEWWEPYWDEDNERPDWLCDHIGDAQDVMEELWKEIIRLRTQEK